MIQPDQTHIEFDVPRPSILMIDTGLMWEMLDIGAYGEKGLQWTIKSSMPFLTDPDAIRQVAAITGTLDGSKTVRFRTNELGHGLFAWNSFQEKWIHINHTWLRCDLLRMNPELDLETTATSLIYNQISSQKSHIHIDLN